MRGVLRQLHRWIGLPLGGLFLITLASGVVVGGEEFLSSLDKHGQQYRSTTIEEDIQAVEKITAEMQGLRSIVMPRPETPYYQGRGRGGIKTFRIGDLALIDDKKRSREDFIPTVLRLHRNYLLGRQEVLGFGGADLSAWVSLGAIALGFVGVYLWWRARRTFGLDKLVPVKSKRRDYFQAHIHGGVIVLLVILLLGLTGASITYRPIGQSVLGAEQISAPGLRDYPLYIEDSWDAWLRRAEASMPGEELARISFPRGGGATEFDSVNPRNAIQFRYVTDKDWLGVAGSRVFIDPGQSGYLGAVRFEALPFGQKLYTMILPLHTGRNISTVYLGVVLVFSILAMVMTFSGVISILIQLAKQQMKRRTAIAAAGRRSNASVELSVRR